LWSIAAPSFPTWKRPRSWASYTRAVWQFERVCREFNPDIVHIHFPLGQCLPVVGACALPHKWRLVTTVHGSDIRVSPQADGRVRMWQDRLFRRTDVVTSVSKALLEDAIRLHPCIAGKGRVIYNGVDPTWFDKKLATNDRADKCVLFVGRLHPMKAVDVLLRAWKLALPRLPGKQLWLAGDGAERESLAALARELSIESEVKFLGKKTSAEIKNLYPNSQLVVLPSRHEGLPMALIESGACGAIRLGTRVAGITEVITDGSTGFLVEPNSPEALAEGMIRATSMNAEERQRMSILTREQMRRYFSQETIVLEYLDLYQNLAALKAVPAPCVAETEEVGDER
jgi:glycosyltransferase involved in cell wall biosynthesis